MRSVGVLFAIAVTGCAFCQAPTAQKPKHNPKVVKSDGKPVSQAEARTTFLRLRKLVGDAAHFEVKPTSTIPARSEVVTRTQVVNEMWAVLEAFKPALKFKPKPARLDEKVLKMSDATARGHLKTLISLGFVGRVAPLATGPKDSLSVAEFGDAVGFYLTRLAQLSHLPSTRWTPMLGAGSD